MGSCLLCDCVKNSCCEAQSCGCVQFLMPVCSIAAGGEVPGLGSGLEPSYLSIDTDARVVSSGSARTSKGLVA